MKEFEENLTEFIQKGKKKRGLNLNEMVKNEVLCKFID